MKNLEGKIQLGDEYDAELRERLMMVLKEMKAVIHEHARGVAGSQELETFSASIGHDSVVIEAETYVGLSIRGDQSIVDEIAARTRVRLSVRRIYASSARPFRP
jgi:hypothetical protein